VEKDRGREDQTGKDIISSLKASQIISSPSSTYLDIGANDGLITKAIGAALQLPNVERWIDQENKVDVEATWSIYLFYWILYDDELAMSIDDFEKDYYGVYRSCDEWDAIFTEHGFKCVHKLQKITLPSTITRCVCKCGS
jgi:hypothetical protein